MPLGDERTTAEVRETAAPSRMREQDRKRCFLAVTQASQSSGKLSFLVASVLFGPAYFTGTVQSAGVALHHVGQVGHHGTSQRDHLCCWDT
jgi:hypothetical protein